MKRYSDLEYLRLNKWQRFVYKLALFFVGIPKWFAKIGIAIGRFFVKLGKGIYSECKDIVMTFANGDWKTRLSYLIFGFGNAARGQIFRGVLFFLIEAVFIFYMITTGGYWLSKIGSLGTVETYNTVDEEGFPIYVYGDNSFKILLYSVLTIFFIIAVIYTWRLNIKQNKIMEEITDSKGRRELAKACKAEIAEINASELLNKQEKEEKIKAIKASYKEQINACGKPLRSGKQDLQSLIDDQFHKTLLALPLAGILIFTVMPIFFMILVAFTNYDANHDGLFHLFTWTGFAAFGKIFNWSSGNNAYSAAFGEILAWTLIWAFFATFTNYFLGMFVAIMINKKGIKLKKVWRTILVLTIAIPQFISLLYVSKMFSDNGIIISFLQKLGVSNSFTFFGDATSARVTVILINIWIGIPYLMLISTGILMNIPADMYESANIDGANVWQQYMKITLPYMIFITGPYLLTSFIGNMNNFNVIYLLTGGGPTNPAASGASGSVGYTDLLITWLFKITMGAESEYYMASVIGILVFVVVSFISLIVYNIMPSTRNEEDYQ